MSAFCRGSAVAAELTVVSWGGAYTKSQVEAYHKPWMAQSGHSIISEDYGGGIAEIKAQVESGNVTGTLSTSSCLTQFVPVTRVFLRKSTSSATSP